MLLGVWLRPSVCCVRCELSLSEVCGTSKKRACFTVSFSTGEASQGCRGGLSSHKDWVCVWCAPSTGSTIRSSQVCSTQPEVEEIRALLTSKSFHTALHCFILGEIMFILGTLKSSFVFSVSVIGRALFYRTEEQRKIVKINVLKRVFFPQRKQQFHTSSGCH